MVETHLSYVFLTSTLVYKMKKPVLHELGDLRTLDGRSANCRAEVRLNRRLAADVYLGLAALMRRDDGALALDDDGEVVEWLVRMQRLPAPAMLDRLILEDALKPEGAAALAKRLGGFFLAEAGVDLSAERHSAQLRQQLESSMLLLGRAGPLLRQSIEAILQDHPPPRLSAFYCALRACVRARLAVAHLLEPTPRRAQDWLPLARDYLSRAACACAELD